MRLSGRRAFGAVYAAQIRRSSGPLLVYGKANGLAHSRLGLSVSRRVGTAVARNRIKRLLREAFRLSQHSLPPGIDLVVVVRPHRTLELVDYVEALSASAAALAVSAKKGL